MSTADGGGGGSANYELDPDSLKNAITKLTQLADRVGTLKSNFSGFAGDVSPADWSSEPACQSFGQTYTSAVSAYSQVIAGMEADVKRYRDSLQAALTSYTTSDDGALDRFNAAIAKLDDTTSANDAAGTAQYNAPSNHGNLESDKPIVAPDTSPNAPGSPNGASGNGASGNGASGNGASGSSGTSRTSTAPGSGQR